MKNLKLRAMWFCLLCFFAAKYLCAGVESEWYQGSCSYGPLVYRCISFLNVRSLQAIQVISAVMLFVLCIVNAFRFTLCRTTEASTIVTKRAKAIWYIMGMAVFCLSVGVLSFITELLVVADQLAATDLTHDHAFFLWTMESLFPVYIGMFLFILAILVCLYIMVVSRCKGFLTNNASKT